MSQTELTRGWVFYRMTIHGRVEQANAVCPQAEWDEMEARRPGYHTLVLSGIATEAEAERLARGTSGDRSAPRRRGANTTSARRSP